MYPNPSESRTNNTLYIGDIEQSVTEPMLYSVFVKYGPMFSLRILRDIATKQSRGFGFVSFYNHTDASSAQSSTNHLKILQKCIRVTWKKNIHELSPANNIFVKNIPVVSTEAG